VLIYRNRFGQEFDMSTWSQEHLDFAKKMYWWYFQGENFQQFTHRIFGKGSPVFNKKSNGPEPTETSLYEVVTDMQLRLAVKQGEALKDWEGEIDPTWPQNE